MAVVIGRTNVSKIVYYGAMQNLIFNSLQQALFALVFGEDDEEQKDAKKNEKISRVANGMIDSHLKVRYWRRSCCCT